MPDRNSIIEKVKALLAKTTKNGCTEAEMLAALAKALAMIDAYDISDAELELAKDEAAILHAEPPDVKDPHAIKWRLTYAVSAFCNVQIYRQFGRLMCIGTPSDTRFAMWLLDSLADFVFAELYAHLIGCLAPPKQRRTVISSFVIACCARISDRIVELVEQSQAARTSNGRALVVVKDQAIKRFMKDRGIRLRTSYGYSPSNVDHQAQAAGRAAGDRATFGRPVTGAAGVLRIAGSKS